MPGCSSGSGGDASGPGCTVGWLRPGSEWVPEGPLPLGPCPYLTPARLRDRCSRGSDAIHPPTASLAHTSFPSLARKALEGIQQMELAWPCSAHHSCCHLETIWGPESLEGLES